MKAQEVLENIWSCSALGAQPLRHVNLHGADPVFPSSFRVATAAQTCVAAAAAAAVELSVVRGLPRQDVSVDAVHAAVEATGWFSLDGSAPNLWDAFSGLYACSDSFVRLHANFKHHKEGALKLLGLDVSTASRHDAEVALAKWKAQDFEDASAKSGLVAYALRSFEQWDATEQATALAQQPLVSFERIGDAQPLPLAEVKDTDRPLTGVNVLDLTRILAGPVGGRTLAAYGAEVMLVNSPDLPNIEAIADTSRGKRSTHVNLKTDEGVRGMNTLLEQAHVFIQGYRPGGLHALGFGAQALAQKRPGIVYVSLSAFGPQGPWSKRRGFDSLLQTAMGFNLAEAEAAGESKPKPMPMQILDEATGFLMAFGACAALVRQQQEGGSWHVQVSLARTGQWLRELGRVSGGFDVKAPDFFPFRQKVPSGFGYLDAIAHSATFSRTPAYYRWPSMRPGSSPAHW